VTVDPSRSVSRAEHESRARLSAESIAKDLSEPRRKYVADFVRSLGLDPSRLDEEQLGYLFAMLARLEEIQTPHKHNGHNWEIAFSSAARQDNALTPEMDIRLREWERDGQLRQLPGSTPLWPENRRFALCLTHDIDHVSGSLLRERARSLPSYGAAPGREKAIVGLSTFREAARSVLAWKPRPDPPLNIWLDEEEKHGFKSSLFFLASPLPAPHWQDSFYSYDDRVSYRGSKQRLRDVMRDIVARGWDVGLHGSSRSSFDPAILQAERNIVSAACGAEVITTRQHHLFYDVRYTPFYHEKAGIQADTTLGSNIAAGFRCGTCFPFFMYDIAAERPLNVLQVPLIVQDVALFNQLGMNEELAVSHTKELMNRVAEVGGVMTLLWHNDMQASNPRFRAYQRILGAAAEMRAWGCSLRQLNEWWRSRPTGRTGAASQVVELAGKDARGT
jgi:hypothetical protein